jgi:hypothetical protein
MALLTGCVTSDPTPAPTGSPSASPVELVVPRSVLDLRCDTTVGSSVLSELIGGSTQLVSDLDADGGVSPGQLEERQLGMQRCQWGDQGSVSAGFAVLPDAAEAFDARNGWFDVNEQYIRVDVLGDRSKHQCSYGYCYADVLVGEVWLTAYAVRSDLMDELDFEPLFLAFAESAVSAVRVSAAGVQRDPWTLPADAFRPVPGWCSDDLLGELGGVLGIPSLYGPGTDGFAGLSFEVWERSGIAQCALSGDVGDREGHGSLEVLPGAAWAIPELLGSTSPYGAYETAEGGGSAVLVASDPAGTAVVAEIGGGLLFLSFEGFARDELLDLLPAVVDVVRAHPAPEAEAVS